MTALCEEMTRAEPGLDPCPKCGSCKRHAARVVFPISLVDVAPLCVEYTGKWPGSVIRGDLSGRPNAWIIGPLACGCAT